VIPGRREEEKTRKKLTITETQVIYRVISPYTRFYWYFMHPSSSMMYDSFSFMKLNIK